MPDQPKTPDHVTIGAFRTSTGGTQIQIAQLDDCNTGFGHRLAGPKHHNMPTTDEVFNGPDEAPDDALTPPQRAARAIQDFHDPVVCGYIIGTESLQLILRPTEWRQWEIWRERLGAEPGSTETHAGGPLAARGRWGDTTVNINVYLDQLPQAAPEATGPDAPATPNSEA